MTKQLNESSEPMPLQAQRACVEKINELFAAIQRDIEQVGKLGADICNYAMQVGLFLQEATGRTQLEMHFFTAIPGLDDRLSFQIATRCVSLATRRAGKKFQSYAEAEPELKLLLQGTLTEPPVRQRVIGTPLQKNWGSWIPTEFSKMNNELRDMFDTQPVEQWSYERLDTFVQHTQFVHDQHEAAMRLLNSKTPSR